MCFVGATTTASLSGLLELRSCLEKLENPKLEVPGFSDCRTAYSLPAATREYGLGTECSGGA